ncbi:uncharacterized protein LOC135202691 [Macrobrachium nipponense]|uniref:uncharacterized protein LOC135202691 n=1 Tax=Macrobrachium nipponense TaxID=159736 RepID=UPI0030C7A49A
MKIVVLLGLVAVAAAAYLPYPHGEYTNSLYVPHPVAYHKPYVYPAAPHYLPSFYPSVHPAVIFGHGYQHPSGFGLGHPFYPYVPRTAPESTTEEPSTEEPVTEVPEE